MDQARKAAQPMCRSVAGQVEYWAALYRIVEHSGLTAQEAQTAIAGYEAANRRKAGPAADVTPCTHTAVATCKADWTQELVQPMSEWARRVLLY